MNTEKKMNRPRMDPTALLELSVLTGELCGRLEVLRTLQDTHQHPGSMRLVVSSLDRTAQRLRVLREDCEVML